MKLFITTIVHHSHLGLYTIAILTRFLHHCHSLRFSHRCHFIFWYLYHLSFYFPILTPLSFYSLVLTPFIFYFTVLTSFVFLIFMVLVPFVTLFYDSYTVCLFISQFLHCLCFIFQFLHCYHFISRFLHHLSFCFTVLTLFVMFF